MANLFRQDLWDVVVESEERGGRGGGALETDVRRTTLGEGFLRLRASLMSRNNFKGL